METLESIIRNKLTPIVNLIALIECGAEDIATLANECNLVKTSERSVADIINLAKAVDETCPHFDARRNLELIEQSKQYGNISI